MHYKIDLLSDEALANYTVQVGDVLILNMPGSDRPSRERVTSRQEDDAGYHPITGEHLTRVSLLLNTISEQE